MYHPHRATNFRCANKYNTNGAPTPADTPLWPSLKAVTDNHAVEVDYESWYLNASLLSAQIILEGLHKVLS
jgi:ABC-type cobalamin/fe3+-siderophores transport system, secreted component